MTASTDLNWSDLPLFSFPGFRVPQTGSTSAPDDGLARDGRRISVDGSWVVGERDNVWADQLRERKVAVFCGDWDASAVFGVNLSMRYTPEEPLVLMGADMTVNRVQMHSCEFIIFSSLERGRCEDTSTLTTQKCRPFSRIDPMHSRPAWFSSLDIILVAIRIWSSVTGEHDAINVNCTHILIIAIVLSFWERAADLPKMQLARSSARKANHNHSCGFSFVTASKHDQPYAHQFVLGSGTWSIASSSYKRWRKWNAKISSPPLNDALVQRACLSCRIEVYKVCERESFSDVEITQIPSIVDWTPSKLQEVLGLLRNAHVSIPATRYSLFWSSG